MTAPDPSRPPRSRLFPAALGVALLLGIWMVLGPLQPYARWVRLEAPAAAQPGSAFKLRLHFPAPPSERFLHVDLHGRESPGTPARVLAATRLPLAPTPTRDFQLEFSLPASASNLARLSCVVYTSDTGTWRDHRRAAHSAPIPILRSGDPSPRPGDTLRSWSMFPLESTSSSRRPSLPAVRVAEGLLFAVSALFLASLTGSTPSPDRRRLRLWAIGFATAAVLAGTDLGPRIAELARQQALRGAWYESRHGLQMLGTAVVIGLGGWLATRSAAHARGVPPGACARAGLVAWFALQALNTVSLHGVDALDAALLPGLSRFDLLRLLLAGLAALSALASAMRSYKFGRFRLPRWRVPD